MASLNLSHIYKVYDNGHKAVNDFNIDIKETMFITWRLDIIFSPVYEEENFNELMREDITEKSNCFKFAYDYFINWWTTGRSNWY